MMVLGVPAATVITLRLLPLMVRCIALLRRRVPGNTVLPDASSRVRVRLTVVYAPLYWRT